LPAPNPAPPQNKPQAALLEPVFTQRIWGARSLAPLYSDKTNLAEPIGEAWLTSIDSRLVTGPLAGLTLGAAWPKIAADSERDPRPSANPSQFPLLAKFIFPQEKLSVQVHPDDAYASIHERAAGGRGKTEMWYVVDAEPGAAVWLGLEEWVTKEKFQEGIHNGTADNYVEKISVQKGDAIFCPAGTVHYIGAGLTLCEIQQYSDITYRVFDYNRLGTDGQPRQLHLEKAMDVIRFGEAQKGGKLSPVQVTEGREREITRTYLVACPYFIVERFDFEKNWRAPGLETHFNVYIVLEGSGELRQGAPLSAIDPSKSAPASPYHPGQAWLAPAHSPALTFAPETKTSVLRAFVPNPVNGLNEFVRDMRANNIPESKWTPLVFS
jgi:mannose-6-phosphate isomerase